MTTLAKILAVNLLVLLAIAGLAAACAIAWLLLPELRPAMRTGLRRATGALRRA